MAGNVDYQKDRPTPAGPVSRSLRVYVSGPYTQGDTEQNVRTAMQAAAALMEAGHAPFCPHLSHYIDIERPQPYDEWLRVDLAWVAVCDAVLRLPGVSPGAEIEVDRAEHLGIPVYYNIGDLT
jgi:hypothetical protein